MITTRFNVVCPDKVIFGLEYEDAMRIAHKEFEAVKHSYIKRYGATQLEILPNFEGVRYTVRHNKQWQPVVFTERVG